MYKNWSDMGRLVTKGIVVCQRGHLQIWSLDGRPNHRLRPELMWYQAPVFMCPLRKEGVVFSTVSLQSKMTGILLKVV